MNKIRVFINYKTTYSPWGGSNSFLCALKKYLSNLEDIDLIYDKNGNYDLMLLNTSVTAPGKFTSLRQIKRFSEYGCSSLFRYFLKGFKKKKIKILLRLDGLRRFYAETTELRGDRIQLDLIKFANTIIFQSNESLNQFKKVIGNIPVQHYVIRNGVNQSIFNIKEREYWNRKDKLRVFATSWSKNSMKGFRDIARLSNIDDVTVNFVGNWPAGIDSGMVNLKPAMSQPLLAEEYKKNDLFFFPSRNEACSNVVLEALSCGLPVIYHPSGGTSEIASSYGVGLKDDLLATLNEVTKNYDVFIERIKKDYFLFSIDYVGEKYVEVFQKFFM